MFTSTNCNFGCISFDKKKKHKKVTNKKRNKEEKRKVCLTISSLSEIIAPNVIDITGPINGDTNIAAVIFGALFSISPNAANELNRKVYFIFRFCFSVVAGKCSLLSCPMISNNI